MSARSAGVMLVRLLATVLLVAPPGTLLAARQEELCRFPSKWQGSWFQSGFRQPILIDGARLSSKGTCIHAEGDKFVVVDEKGCHRCVVIHEKHANVLQYKETFCHPRDALPTLCSLITGDALLFSMFRVEAHPVACPFNGPFTFTYNRGHGDCRSPVSSIDSCTEESRLLLSYQACPDVHGTESTVEELQCLATWKEGSSRYLVGKITHTHATSNEDRYRCFVYEKTEGPGKGAQQQDYLGLGLEDVKEELDVAYRVAQSGDATCNGLASTMEGSRTMTLKTAATPSKCRFPAWLTASSSHWHTLDYTRSYIFLHNTTLRIANTTSQKQTQRQQHQHQQQAVVSMGLTSQEEGQAEMRVECTQVKQASPDVAYVVTHFTMGCQSGFVCMVFYRRDGHVIEVQTGGHVRRAEDACNAHHFNRTTQPFVTLVTSSPEPRQCPYLGKFSVTGVTRDDHHLFRSARSPPSDRAPPPSPRRSASRRKRDAATSSHEPDVAVETRDAVKSPPWVDNDLRGHDDPRNRSHVDATGRHLSHGDLLPRSNRDEAEGDERSAKRATGDARRGKRSGRDPEGLSNDPCGPDGEDFTTLVVGCSTMDTMEFRSECMTDVVSAYSCHGRWEDNGTHYLITTPLSRSSHGARRYCFMYRETDGIVHFSSSADSCQRNISPGVGGALAFNVTSSGQCVEANSSPTIRYGYFLIALSLLIIVTTNFHLLQTLTIQR